MEQSETGPEAPASSMAGLAAAMAEHDGAFIVDGARGWLQGRTMYGGASSFLALAAVRRRFPDLPPLRSAQIGFIAPVGDSFAITVNLLRQGRNVVQISTDITCEGALAHRTIWLFGATRPANADLPAERLDDLWPVDQAKPLADADRMPGFVQRMELRSGTPAGGLRPGVFRRWVRLREPTGMVVEDDLVLVGDALPPGSLRLNARPGALSSINWSLTMLGGGPATRDGWWLLETASNGAAEGFSSETLRCWNADGVEVMRVLQSVAIFG